MRYALYIVCALALVAAGLWGVRQYNLAHNTLLPDLVPLPARDVQLVRTATSTALRFSTTYVNLGAGPLELRFDADPKARGDQVRHVAQRVYRASGAYTDTKVGEFLWHQEHLHYHFADFVHYTFERIDGEQVELLNDIKATFCMRDVSRVVPALPGQSPEGAYKVCGKDVQGSSVGWGETYYFDYPGQSIDVTHLASGTYRLTTTLNPDNFLHEASLANNVAQVVFVLDQEHGTLSAVQETPGSAPQVEHVRLPEPFGIGVH